MFQVLQCSMDRDLHLYSDVKEHTNPVARLKLLALSSQPADHEVNGHQKHATSDIGKILPTLSTYSTASHHSLKVADIVSHS